MSSTGPGYTTPNNVISSTGPGFTTPNVVVSSTGPGFTTPNGVVSTTGPGPTTQNMVVSSTGPGFTTQNVVVSSTGPGFTTAPYESSTTMTTPLCTDFEPIDFIFVLDSSSSLGLDNWDLVLRFAADFVAEIPSIGQNQSRLADAPYHDFICISISASFSEWPSSPTQMWPVSALILRSHTTSQPLST